MITLVVVVLGIWMGLGLSQPTFVRLLGLGLLGVLTLTVIESIFAIGIMRLTVAEYLAGYDLSAGALFPLGLTAMAIAPLIPGIIRR